MDTIICSTMHSPECILVFLFPTPSHSKCTQTRILAKCPMESPVGQRSFSFVGASLWHSLPPSVCAADSLLQFSRLASIVIASNWLHVHDFTWHCHWILTICMCMALLRLCCLSYSLIHYNSSNCHHNWLHVHHFTCLTICICMALHDYL